MALGFAESVVHESIDVIVTQNDLGDELVFWKLTDTRYLPPDDEEAIVKALRSEIQVAERTGVVMEDTGYTKIYHPHMRIMILTDVEETIEKIIGEMRVA